MVDGLIESERDEDDRAGTGGFTCRSRETARQWM